MPIADFFADRPGTCLLHSGGRLDSAQRSFLALFPYESIKGQGGELVHYIGNTQRVVKDCHPWLGLQEFFFDSLQKSEEAFTFGFFGYEMGTCADPDKPLPYFPNPLTPDSYWQRCAIVLIYDHHSGEATVIAATFALDQVANEQREWARRLCQSEGWNELFKCLSLRKDRVISLFPLTQVFLANRKEAYLAKVEAAREWIRAGEIYQVNLSQPFIFQGRRRPFDVFCQVNALNPAPFSAYFNTAAFTIVSTSPERFLQKKGQVLETRPIKGTIKRGKTPEEDRQLKEQLLASPKERAELLMITDLMRNDLGKISQIGSVETLEIWRCEAYTNVYHLLSIIRSLAKEELTPLELIRACFPGGSITGCPKLRAMELINQLEGKPRGVYTGSIGYVNGKNDFDLNIAIRTLIFTPEQITLQFGGGIVIDSNPEQEFQETLVKGESLFRILQVDRY